MNLAKKKSADPAFLTQLRAVLALATSLKACVWFVAALAALSLVEIVLPLPVNTFVVALAVGLLFSLLIFFRKYKRLENDSLQSAALIYRQNQLWLPFSPVVMLDIFRGKVLASDYEKRELLAYGRQKNNGLSSLPMQAWYRHTGLPGLHVPAATMLLLLAVCLILRVSPVRIADTTRYQVVTQNEVEVTPPGGEWFSGSDIPVRVSPRGKQFKVIAIEILSHDGEKKIYAPASHPADGNFSLKLDNVRNGFSLKATLKKGYFTYHTNSFKFKIREPAGIKSLSHTIYPPAYTGQAVFKSTDSFLRMYYGSRIVMKAELDAGASLKIGGKVIRPTNLVHEYATVFMAQSPEKKKYSFLSVKGSTVTETDSPEYEFVPAQDSAPAISIDGVPPTGAEMRLPESGNISFKFTATDDFGLRETGLALLAGDRLLKKMPLLAKRVGEKDDSGKITFVGSAKILPKDLKAKNLSVVVYCRDNSLIPGQYRWEKKSKSGQIATSQTIQIYSPENAHVKEQWQDKQAKQDAMAIQALAEKYAQSEKEIQDLADRARRGEKVDSEAERWADERRELQNEARNLAKSPLLKDKNAGKEEKARAEAIKSALEKLLDEKIVNAEQQLKKLLQEMPKDFASAKREIQRMSKEEYLQNLQNSVINLKKLLALKELRELKNELNTWEKEIVKKQAALVAEKQSPEARKQQSRDFAKRAEKNFEKAKKTDNEFGTKAYPTESKKSEINESIESSNSGDSQKQDIENLANLRKALASWKEDIENEIEKKSNAEQQRTVRALRAAALRVQQTSDVLESQTLANKAYTNQKSAEAVVQLRDSFRNVFAVLAQETGDTGLVPAEIIMQAKETDAFFQDTSASAETNQAMTFKSNVERLRWKLNKLSLALLKEMGNMRMQMAGMTSQGLGESMSGQGQGEGDKETLQKMGKEQSGKNSELSPEEKAFLEDAAQRMSEQAKRINQLSSRKEIEGTTASKEAKAISEELKAEAERAKTVKRRTGVADLSAKQQAREKKFLNHARSLKQKETESKERESDSAREYNLSPAVRKDDKKPNVSTVIYDDSDISDSKKLFLERFRRNFMQSEK